MAGNSPFRKKMILLFAAALLLASFFLLPYNNNWLRGHLVRYWTNFPTQRSKLAEEQRLEARFGTYYTCSRQIAKAVEIAGGKKDVLIVIPPTTYFKERHIDYHVPEPAVFYYFTGYRITWPENRDAEKATWYVRAEQSRIIVDSVGGLTHFADTLALFRKYKSAL